MSHYLIAKLKLEKIDQQIRTVLSTDYAYEDSRAALKHLSTRIDKAKSQIEGLDSRSESLRNGILRHVNFIVDTTTNILGIIARSASTRNAFEFYVPFLDICKILLDENAKLILSSEWNFVPFTYPQNLDGLPEFVIIGLPASESENSLIFPAAGHELGHSVWAKSRVREIYINSITDKTISVLVENKKRFEDLFPQYKDANLVEDLFAQQIVARITQVCLRQLEECFCDFIGVCIFGRSYLFAYKYLIYPSLSGERALFYPETRNRAKIISAFADRFNLGIENFELDFISDSKPNNPFDEFIVSMADVVCNGELDSLSDLTISITSKRGVIPPTNEEVEEVQQTFRGGIPSSACPKLGALIGAAWTLWQEPAAENWVGLGRDGFDLLNDLVLKSAEITEYAKIVK